MSATLAVFVPLALLGLVAALGFVGCSFHGHGTVTPFSDYQGTVKNTAGLVAFWPLNETAGTIASDAAGQGHDGTYTPQPSVPYDPVNQSAAATGAVDLGQA